MPVDRHSLKKLAKYQLAGEINDLSPSPLSPLFL